MANKKKKINRDGLILKEVDKSLDHTYDALQEEIENMQNRLIMADKKARKKAKKATKKNKNITSAEVNRIKKQARDEILSEMQQTSLLERITKAFEDIAPIIVVIARLVASLICAILSLDVVKTTIKPEMMASLDKVYKKAMSISM